MTLIKTLCIALVLAMVGVALVAPTASAHDYRDKRCGNEPLPACISVRCQGTINYTDRWGTKHYHCDDWDEDTTVLCINYQGLIGMWGFGCYVVPLV